MNIQKELRFMFLFNERVSRQSYLVTGCLLMLLKFFGEWSVARLWFGVDYSLSAFLLPSYNLKATLFQQVQRIHSVDHFFLFFILWTLPFMWIGVSMSVRRAHDAGLSPILGLLFLTPFLNFLSMLILAAAPTRGTAIPPEDSAVRKAQADEWRASLTAVVAANVIALPVIYISTVMNSSYGMALFVGLPTIMGAVASWIWNRSGSRGYKSSIAIACFAIFVSSLVLLLIAFEGLICVLMALPFALVGGVLGGIIGEYLARWPLQPNMGMHCTGLILVLSLATSLEGKVASPGSASATTSIEIAANVMTVFNNVVQFSELPPPTETIFKAGVAYPIRARIKGQGVGAIRYCEFSTGPFVEPITAWEPGSRLAFSVSEQPPTMEELSLYKKISPRHLTETFKSVRGEFRITALSENRSLLEGTTWYELQMEPFPYWAFLTNQLVHEIHGRVLRHIRDLSEVE